MTILSITSPVLSYLSANSRRLPLARSKCLKRVVNSLKAAKYHTWAHRRVVIARPGQICYEQVAGPGLFEGARR